MASYCITKYIMRSWQVRMPCSPKEGVEGATGTVWLKAAVRQPASRLTGNMLQWTLGRWVFRENSECGFGSATVGLKSGGSHNSEHGLWSTVEPHSSVMKSSCDSGIKRLKVSFPKNCAERKKAVSLWILEIRAQVWTSNENSVAHAVRSEAWLESLDDVGITWD